MDASPELGRELIGIRENTLVFAGASLVPRVNSRLVAIVGLGFRRTTAADKGMAALFSLWREYGPERARAQLYLESLRGLATDLGTEFFVGGARDALRHLYDQDAAEGEAPNTFARALRLPGWNHLLHGVCEHATHTCWPWFPGWRSRAQALLEFFVVDRGYMEDLLARLGGDSADAAVRALLQRPLDRLVSWRWGAVVGAARALGQRRGALRRGHVEVGGGGRSAALEAADFASRDTPGSAQFWYQTAVVVAVLGPVEALRVWGGGCECHGAAAPGSRAEPCSLRGRRLPTAWAQVLACTASLAGALRSRPLEWPWLREHGLLPDFVRGVQQVMARLDLKLSLLDALPYKIARCRDVAVARETRAGFDRCLCTGVEQPDLVSCHVFEHWHRVATLLG